MKTAFFVFSFLLALLMNAGLLYSQSIKSGPTPDRSYYELKKKTYRELYLKQQKQTGQEGDKVTSLSSDALQLDGYDTLRLQLDQEINDTSIAIAKQKYLANPSKSLTKYLRQTRDSMYNTIDQRLKLLKAKDTRKQGDTWAAATLAKQWNDSSTIHVLATGGISNLQDTKNMGGNLGIGLQFRVSDWIAGKRGWADPHFIYIMFNAKTNSSEDSSILARAVLFPEIAKRDFVAGYFFRITKNDFTIEPTAEFSLNKYVDSIQTFRTESISIGCGFAKAFTVPNLNTPVSLRFFPYYNLINIDPKYWKAYDSMIKDPTNAHATFHTIGLQTFLQVDKVIMFCNAKYVLNKASAPEESNRDFVRFVYTVGTMVAL